MDIALRYYSDGKRRNAAPPDRALFANSAWQLERFQSAGVERDCVCGLADLHMAWSARAIWQLAPHLGFIPVVPTKQNQVEPWEHNRAMYKVCNEIERLLRRRKGFRRIFSRFDRLDVMFMAFINFALIAEE